MQRACEKRQKRHHTGGNSEASLNILAYNGPHNADDTAKKQVCQFHRPDLSPVQPFDELKPPATAEATDLTDLQLGVQFLRYASN